MIEDKLTDVLVTKLDETEIQRVLAELKKAWIEAEPKGSDATELCIAANFVNYIVWLIEQRIYDNRNRETACMFCKYTFLSTLFTHWKMDPMQVAIDLSNFPSYINLTKPEENNK